MAMEAIVAALTEDVLEGGRVVVDVDGLEIGIFRLDGRLYAWENRCVMLGGPVCQGTLMNRVTERLDDERRSLGDDFAEELHIVCPWHGYEYDVRTGMHPGGSAGCACAASRSRSAGARSLSVSDAVARRAELLRRRRHRSRRPISRRC